MVEEQVCPLPQELNRGELELEVISDADRFNSIGVEWDELVDRAGIDHVFLSHTWLRTWWEVFGNGNQLHVITVRSDGQLIAAAPMMITRSPMFGMKVRRIESLYNHHTPRFDLIVADRSDEVYRLMWKEISNPKLNCGVIVFAQVPDTSPTLAEMEALARAEDWLIGHWDAPPSPFVKLDCSYDEYLLTLKDGYRYNLSKRHERLSKLGPVDKEVITASVAVRDAMQDGFRIEAAAWKGEEGTAMNSDPNVAEFYSRFAERAADLGWLSLTFLRMHGKRIAFDYIVRRNRTVCCMKTGYDPEYHSYSPGHLLLNLILEEACSEGIAEYDFLGADDEWKFDWTKETRGHRWLFLFQDGFRARVLHYLKFSVAPKLKSRHEVLRLRDMIHGLQGAFK